MNAATQGNSNTQIERRQDEDAAMTRAAGAAGSGTTMQRISTQYTTALSVQAPRNMQRIEATAIYEAKMMGEDVFYGWDVNDKNAPGGKKRVEGMTIQGAMMLLRNWGNCVCDVKLKEVAYEAFLFEATLIDLETGTTSNRLYRKNRSDPPGRYEQQRWDDMEFSDGQSRAVRNVITLSLPQWLQDRCIKAAFAGEQEGVNPETERKAVVSRALGIGVSQKQLEAKMGKAVSKLEAHDLVSLRAMLRTVEENHARADELFAVKMPDDTTGTPRTAQTMEAAKPGEPLVKQFAARLRVCCSLEDLRGVRVGIQEAITAGKLTDENEKDELSDIYREQKLKFSDHKKSASPSSPGATT